MNGKQVFSALNGKKIPITLFVFILLTAVGYGEIKQKVATNSEILIELKETPIQMARVEEQVIAIDENVEKLEIRQEKRFDKLEAQLSKIYRAVR